MSEPVESERLKYLGVVLEAYFRWCRMGNHLGYTEAIRVIGIPEPVEDRRIVDLSDDDFLRVDQALTKLYPEHRYLIEREYNDSAPAHLKARAMGYGGQNNGAIVAQYRRDVRHAEAALYPMLMPDIELWESAKPTRQRKRA